MLEKIDLYEFANMIMLMEDNGSTGREILNVICDIDAHTKRIAYLEQLSLKEEEILV